MRIEKKMSEGISGVEIHLAFNEMSYLKQMAQECINAIEPNKYDKVRVDSDTAYKINHFFTWFIGVVEGGESHNDAIKSLGFDAIFNKPDADNNAKPDYVKRDTL